MNSIMFCINGEMPSLFILGLIYCGIFTHSCLSRLSLVLLALRSLFSWLTLFRRYALVPFPPLPSLWPLGISHFFLLPLSKNDSWCETIHLQKKSFARRLLLKQRHNGSWKWAVIFFFFCPLKGEIPKVGQIDSSNMPQCRAYITVYTVFAN